MDVAEPTKQAMQELANWASFWMRGAEVQLSRVRAHPAGQGGSATFFDAIQCVSACHKAVAGAKSILGKTHPAVEDFERRHAAKDIRDMHEHFDEYVTGAGRLRTTELAEVPWAPAAQQLVGEETDEPLATAVNAFGRQVIIDEAVRAAAELVDAAVSEVAKQPS